MKLPTKAEQCADKARHVMSFSNFSLIGVRQEVTQLLHLIGRVEGLFSTYTMHDISHVDKMLRMLDWVIPDSTKRVLSEADWLMITLAIYLHDLGMIVTAHEYDDRANNREFVEWRENLRNSNEGREYLARISELTDAEKDRFFFQEFIRRGHANRIREWITGRHSRTWGPEVTPISRAVAELLKPLPSRFREHLAIVCESHHSDNLEDLQRFPLCAPCGDEDGTLVNVQYAALLLRTVDLLHVTKDRTPSVMYKSIRLSDPKAVDEWDKQLGAFTVRPIGRTLDEADPDTAVIIVHADFSEERPLFSLQEYITYANNQILQSKRWADASCETHVDAREYRFPWHSVRGDVRLEGVPPLPLRFELDRGKLLDLLVGHTIYNDATVAIRELLQNAIDAVRYQNYLDTKVARAENRAIPAMGSVKVHWNPSTRWITISDEGTGMSRSIIENNLMRVGASFYNSPEFESQNRDFVPISRFGIGILTCFMVSDDIEIVTFSRGKGHRLRMTSVHADYLLRELPRGDPKSNGIEPHGTHVSLRLRADIELANGSIEQIVRHWIILPECTVMYQEEGGSPTRIGFGTPAEALEHHIRAFRRVLPGSEGDARIVSKKREMLLKSQQNPADYELAFLVEGSKYLPDFRFVREPEQSDLPSVCIEGIRVSEQLPWFSKGGIVGILSVRNDRTFRTTVSRSGLEADQEYDRVGSLCLDMAFEHVSDEVERIAAKPGEPLSQASTASKWLLDDLSRVIRGRAHNALYELQLHLKCLVIEQVESMGKVPIRSMISLHDLNDIASFWTVESRLVDSLGTISRDLGRELSLHLFLSSLAPDYTQLRYSPLLPDAHLFTGAIRRSHLPSRVEFSFQHQQSAVLWTRKEPETSHRGITIQSIPLETQRKVQELIRDAAERFHGTIFVAGTSVELDVCEHSGDVDEIDVVVTRMGVSLRPNSSAYEFWRELVSLVTPTASPRLIADTMLAASVYKEAIASGNIGSGTDARYWPYFAETLNETLRAEQLDFQVPTKATDLVPAHKIFDARRYWKNWISRDLKYH